MQLDFFDFYGLKVSSFNLEELEKYLLNSIRLNNSVIAYGYSFGLLQKFKNYPEIYHYSNLFDIMVADGIGIYWLSKLLGFPIRTNISIPEFTVFLLHLANEERLKVMLLGAKNDTLDQAINNLSQQYPKVEFCPSINGYFEPNEEMDIIQRVNKQNPHILLVGLPTPKKEAFTHKWKSELKPSIIVPCGGMINVFGGKQKLTPFWLKRIGLAWLVRLLQQPISRLKLTIGGLLSISILFPYLICLRLFRRDKDFSIPRFFGVR